MSINVIQKFSTTNVNLINYFVSTVIVKLERISTTKAKVDLSVMTENFS